MGNNKDNENNPFGVDKDFVKKYFEVESRQLYFSWGGNTGTLRGRIAPEKIEHLDENQIFVFGSNIKGEHAGGTSSIAMKRFGAKWGEAHGLQGQSYAICTSEGLIDIARNISHFLKFASLHPELEFFVTPIGCGHAGYNPMQIAPLFSKAIILPNVFLPYIFWEYFWLVAGTGPDYFHPNENWKVWGK